MAILNEKKFEEPVGEKLYRLTNVHPSFDGAFTMLRDDSNRRHVIRRKNGNTLFEGYLDGVPRYIACVDIDQDGDQDVLVELAAYGNHGNGTESFEVLLNEKGRLTHLKNAIAEEVCAGQRTRAGLLTWHSNPKFCAVFIGEEADVRLELLPGEGWQLSVHVGQIRKIEELWGHKNGKMCLISKSATPIGHGHTKYLWLK